MNITDRIKTNYLRYRIKLYEYLHPTTNPSYRSKPTTRLYKLHLFGVEIDRYINSNGDLIFPLKIKNVKNIDNDMLSITFDGYKDSLSLCKSRHLIYPIESGQQIVYFCFNKDDTGKHINKLQITKARFIPENNLKEDYLKI